MNTQFISEAEIPEIKNEVGLPQQLLNISNTIKNYQYDLLSRAFSSYEMAKAELRLSRTEAEKKNANIQIHDTKERLSRLISNFQSEVDKMYEKLKIE